MDGLLPKCFSHDTRCTESVASQIPLPLSTSQSLNPFDAPPAPAAGIQSFNHLETTRNPAGAAVSTSRILDMQREQIERLNKPGPSAWQPLQPTRVPSVTNLGPPSSAPPAAVAAAVLVAIVGTMMVSYTKARAQSIGVPCEIGLMERPERLIGLIAGAAFNVLVPMMIVLAVLTNVTALQRIFYTRRAAARSTSLH